MWNSWCGVRHVSSTVCFKYPLCSRPGDRAVKKRDTTRPCRADTQVTGVVIHQDEGRGGIWEGPWSTGGISKAREGGKKYNNPFGEMFGRASQSLPFMEPRSQQFCMCVWSEHLHPLQGRYSNVQSSFIYNSQTPVLPRCAAGVEWENDELCK